jgi:hypothetical protein
MNLNEDEIEGIQYVAVAGGMKNTVTQQTDSGQAWVAILSLKKQQSSHAIGAHARSWSTARLCGRCARRVPNPSAATPLAATKTNDAGR